MAGEGSPEVVIPLRDGGELRVGAEGVGSGERLYALSSIQDARQVAPNPETIALRVAGAGLVEFQPARAGDGAVALEALYRLRPDLRPAGFEPAPTVPATFPSPPAGQPNAPPTFPPYAPPPGYLPPGYPPPPPGYAPYGYPAPPGYVPVVRNPNLDTPQLTPVPRDFGQTLAAIFTLYGRHFVKWLLLALCVALLPALVAGGFEIWLDAQLLGLDPTKGTSQLFSTIGTSPTPTVPLANVSGSDVLTFAAVALGLLIVSLILGAWQTAALSLGAREALLGRPVSVARSVGGGLRRLPRTLATTLVFTLILIGAGFVVYVPFIVLIIGGSIGATAIGGSSDAQSAFAASLALTFFGACIELIALLIVTVLLGVRIGLAPYATATAGWGPFEAIGRSWQLTRGNFWRVLGVLFIVGIIVIVAALAAGQVASVSIIGAYLIAVPIVQVLMAPLLAIAYTTLLYDLRLRHEGYAAVTGETGAEGAATATSTTGATSG